jgi:hypothetical protein
MGATGDGGVAWWSGTSEHRRVREPERGREPPKGAEELLVRYAAGEREFSGADLSGANLVRALLVGANLTGAQLVGANLTSADLVGAGLTGARLVGANLTGADFGFAKLNGAKLSDANLTGAGLAFANLAHADLSGANLNFANLNFANLARADLRGAVLLEANVIGADLGDATFDGAMLGGTVLDKVDLTPLCEASHTLSQLGPSTIGDAAILRSLAAPKLHEFLVRCGVLDVVATYRIDAFRSLDALGEVRLLHSTFISYGNPDEPFARKLYEALHRNGVTTFFFPEHSVPGERLHRMMRKGVNDFDRMILVCSKDSLDRKGVLNELEEILAREARDGGASYLIPIALDEYVFAAWKPFRNDIAQAVRDRVVANFQGADIDDSKFRDGLRRLLDALKK